MAWALATIGAVLELKAAGASDHAITAQTGVPVGTIRTWRRRGTAGDA